MKKRVAIIGAGPAGLMAAEVIATAGHEVTVYDRMPSPARKLLIAGRGGLNLTHSEELEKFITRYGAASSWIEPYIKAYTPTMLRAWADDLGQETFVGSSGRVFPRVMKAGPLLRAWLQKLEALGVKYAPRHRWQGFEDNALQADAVLLALGGASWPRLGSDGGWVKILEDAGIEVSKLQPSNSGFMVNWSAHFSERFAGQPLKSVAVSHNGLSRQGEAMITAKGIEGGVIYALSASIRESINKIGFAEIQLDLRPGLKTVLPKPRKQGESLSNYLKKNGFAPVAINLLREAVGVDEAGRADEAQLSGYIKALPLKLTATAGIERAISSAGGIKLSEVNKDLMLVKKPGVFIAGEMLDWEAPTGGYLLQGCFSTAVAAAQGVLKYL